MNQLIGGLIAGIIGGFIVLLIGIIQNRKNKLSNELPVGKEWNRFLMAAMYILTGFLPLAGIILGIVGLFFKSKRKQGMFLLFFTIGLITIYALEKNNWGMIFGILIAIVFSVYFKRYTAKSIGIAIFIFIVLAIGYDKLIHTNYFWNNVTYPLGWEHPH